MTTTTPAATRHLVLTNALGDLAARAGIASSDDATVVTVPAALYDQAFAGLDAFGFMPTVAEFAGFAQFTVPAAQFA